MIDYPTCPRCEDGRVAIEARFRLRDEQTLVLHAEGECQCGYSISGDLPFESEPVLPDGGVLLPDGGELQPTGDETAPKYVESRSGDDTEPVGIALDATILTVTSQGRSRYHIPRRCEDGEWEPICPNRPQRKSWNDKTVAQVIPIYSQCTACAQHIRECEGGTEIAHEPDALDPETTEVFRRG